MFTGIAFVVSPASSSMVRKRISGAGNGADSGKKARIEDYVRSSAPSESEIGARMMTDWMHLCCAFDFFAEHIVVCFGFKLPILA